MIDGEFLSYKSLGFDSREDDRKRLIHEPGDRPFCVMSEKSVGF
jgi:hypothetical protein